MKEKLEALLRDGASKIEAAKTEAELQEIKGALLAVYSKGDARIPIGTQGARGDFSAFPFRIHRHTATRTESREASVLVFGIGGKRREK